MLPAVFAARLALPAHAETRLTYGESGPNRGIRAAATDYFTKEISRRSGG